MNCKNCQREIPENVQGSFCPYCGAALSAGELFEYDASQPTTPPEPPSSLAFLQSPTSAPEPEYYVHWEDRDRLGFLRAFGHTWSEATFRPTDFFRKAAPLGHLGSALLFAFFVGMVSSLISLFWQYQFWGSFGELKQFEELFGVEFGRNFLRVLALLSPFLVLVSLLLKVLIYHVSLLIVGSGNSGWEATFRAICYSYGPLLFDCIPWCGGLIAIIWQFVVMIIGWRELHHSSTTRAVFAALLPFLVCCSLVVLLVYQFAAFFSKSGIKI